MVNSSLVMENCGNQPNKNQFHQLERLSYTLHHTEIFMTGCLIISIGGVKWQKEERENPQEKLQQQKCKFLRFCFFVVFPVPVHVGFSPDYFKFF